MRKKTILEQSIAEKDKKLWERQNYGVAWKKKKRGAGYIGAKTVSIFNKINVFTASAFLINV